MIDPVDVIVEADGWDTTDIDGLAMAACGAVYQHLGLQGFGCTVLACDDARIAALNADFRGKPQPTNVLSWPSQERAAAVDGATPQAPDPTDPELGDIAIALETTQAEAVAAGKTMADHTTHLIVHGLLHLLGYDHERDADATLMEGLETQILGNMGIADPYRV